MGRPTRRAVVATGGALAASALALDPTRAVAALDVLSRSRATSALVPDIENLQRPEDEDGYELWLRYRPVDDPGLLPDYRAALTHVVSPDVSGVLGSAVGELVRGLSGLLDVDTPREPEPIADGAVIVGTPESSELVAEHADADELAALGGEGYLLRRITVAGFDAVLVAGMGERGVLYGAFHLLRWLQTRRPIAELDVAERPANPLRMVDHWDNLNRTVERGYAGSSIFDWDELPQVRPRYTDYARALASVGINGTVVNNVNANATYLASDRLEGLAALVDVLRDWGVRFYLSANFASPMVLDDEIDTADPDNDDVRNWWRDKAAEIYAAIPDFGGFLVKANSEGRPGPIDYGKTHADGANLIARAVAPHGGIVIWRSFVHEGFADWAEYQHAVFAPLDGDFDANVAVQTKNGPLDFQVREPVNPLFGALPNTNQLLELQITQEYTGQSTHLCYLVPQWKAVLDFDTLMGGPGSTVASIVDGTAYGQTTVGMAGVINFGTDRNWTGHHLAAANTHGFGRLAWNPAIDAAAIAQEWVQMTFGPEPEVIWILTAMLTRSWEIYEDYTVPLGLGGHLVAPGGAHFHPNPWASPAHQSDAAGSGFDRSIATGTGYPALYHQDWAAHFESLGTCPDEHLFFMHKVPYTHVLRSGKTVIQHIYDSHFEGLEDAEWLRGLWRDELVPHIDARRHAEVLERFDRQVEHARLWRDAIVGYFFAHSRILDDSRGWLQIDTRDTFTLLLGGVSNQVPLEIGNGSGEDLTVRATFVAPSQDWIVVPGERHIASTGSGTALASVRPPVVAELFELDVELEPGDLAGLGVSGRSFVVTPAAEFCRLALDAGHDPGDADDPILVGGYTRLSPASAWDPERGFGWVGAPPLSRDRGGIFDHLRRDFVNDSGARRLRIAIGAGRHQVDLLVGDGYNDAHPTFVRADGDIVAETPFLPAGSFAWLHIALDGDEGGREVDLDFSSIPGEHWHLCALVIVDPP